MKRKRRDAARRFLVLAFVAVMVLQLAACGKAEEEAPKETQWVWVPEYIDSQEIDGNDNPFYYNTQLVGGDICYVSGLWDDEAEEYKTFAYRYSLTDGVMNSTPLSWQEGQENNSLNNATFGADGSIWGTTYVMTEEPAADSWARSAQYLCKFDESGRQVIFQDLSDRFDNDSDNTYISRMAMDGQGRLYIVSNTVIWLYDGEGNYVATVSLGDNGAGWIQSLGADKDGRVYVSYYSRTEMSGSYVMAAVDFDNRKIGETYADFPGSQGFGPGMEKDFLMYDNDRIYEYELATQTSEEVLTWMDSDINGNYVDSIGSLDDGRLVAVIRDWESEENGIALLTKTDASQVAQKESIVIATLSSAYNIQSAAVKFNKKSDKWRITVREYFDYDYDNYSQEGYLAAWSDALTRLNNDITSNNCPDIIDLSDVNVKQLAEKGVFEDLGVYLDGSSVIGRSDFLENILEAYTYDGTLVTIPTSFALQTVVGRAADVGTEMGWTLDEIIAYADAHPEAQLFDGANKSALMRYMMMFNEDAFIDWTTQECRFDTDDFKKLLEFTNRFPEESNYDYEVSTPAKIQAGDVLLETAYISEFNDVQIFEEIFEGEYTFIGFPTLDGGSGCSLYPLQTYAITAKSQAKEGAWAFLEQLLTEDNNRYTWGFPAVKAKLDAQIKEATKNYYEDEDGNPILDENGEVILRDGTSSMSYQDGWSYTYHVVTQEEVDKVMELMRTAKPLSGSGGNDEITNIIVEEAEAFYKGQKSVDEVADIIQSRVKMYVSTNS